MDPTQRHVSLSLEKKGELYDLFRRNIKKRKVF